MNQYQKIYNILKRYFCLGRQEAINIVTQNISKDIASVLYDLIKQQRDAIQNLLPQDKQYSRDEFEKVCENDQKTIQKIIGSVRIDEQQPMNNSNNQSNDSNDQTNNQQNQDDFSKNLNILLVEQNTQYKNKIHFLEDLINQYQINNDKLIKLNNLLMEKIQEKNNILLQLQQQVQDKTNEFEIILLKTQLKSVNENSIKIPVDNQQFTERIDYINKERDQIIRNIEDILKQFEQLQSRNTIKQNIDNQQIDQDEYQNIINQFKGSIEVIISMQTSLQDFEKQLESKLENQNNQSKEIIKNLIQQLKRNRECFIYVKTLLESTLKMLNEMKEINVLLIKRNQELSKQLEEFQNENNKIKEDFQVQINQLKEYYQKEQQGITNEETIQNQTNNQQIQIEQAKNIILFLEKQNTEYKNKIHFLEQVQEMKQYELIPQLIKLELS